MRLQSISLLLGILEKSRFGLILGIISIHFFFPHFLCHLTRIIMHNNYKDTLVCVTADHGYSFNRYPLRDSVVNNLHGENYHIPFYLINSTRKFRYDKLMLGKDIVATLYDECGFDVPDGVTGISIIDDTNQRDSVIIEYMGPGCPDIRNRKAWFSARSKTRVVSVKANVCTGNITQNDIVEVYNLIEDPLEENNVAKELFDEECDRLFMQIVDRANEIRSEYNPTYSTPNSFNTIVRIKNVKHIVMPLLINPTKLDISDAVFL